MACDLGSMTDNSPSQGQNCKFMNMLKIKEVIGSIYLKDRHDDIKSMLDVYRGRKTTIQQQYNIKSMLSMFVRI